MLISEKYRLLNEELHKTREDYGAHAGTKWGKVLSDLCRNLKTWDVLDYGCGKGSLRKSLPGANVKNYDPAIPQHAADPDPADIVACFDVLEHIEPECIDDVIDHMFSKAKMGVILIVATRKAKKFYSNGENAHLIVEDVYWWLNMLSNPEFQLQQLNNMDDAEFLAIYKRRDYQKPTDKGITI